MKYEYLFQYIFTNDKGVQLRTRGEHPFPNIKPFKTPTLPSTLSPHPNPHFLYCAGTTTPKSIQYLSVCFMAGNRDHSLSAMD